MATDVSTQFVREAPEIEAQKLGLLQSSKSLVDAANQAALQGRYLNPSYQVAGFSPDQVKAMEAARTGIGAYQPYMATATQQATLGRDTLQSAVNALRGSDTRSQFGAAQQALTQANIPLQQMARGAEMSMNAAYQPGFDEGIAALYRAAGQAQQASQLGAAPTVDASLIGRLPQVGTERIQAAQVQGAPADIQARNIQAAQSTYRPELTTFQMSPYERVQTETFTTPGAAQAYMSPYMQNVVERQQHSAQREADIQAQTQKAQFAQAGAFGGSRQGVQQARMAEALARQKGDIQAQGLQSAYQQAQQQFNAEQQAKLSAAQANQQAGLTAGIQNLASALGVQQLGAGQNLQVEMANLTNEQQARMQNEANSLQAQGMSAQNAMQVALANQQAQQQSNVQNAANALQASGMNAQQAMQVAMANQQAQQQSALANQQARMQYGLQGGQMALQAADALRQAGMGQIGAAGQRGQLGLQGGQQVANIYGQQAQLGQQQAQGIGSLAGQQFNIGQGLAQGLGSLAGQQGSMAGLLANLGAQQQSLGQQDVNFLYNIGAQQQRQNQAVLDATRQNTLQQNMQPFQMLGFLSDIYKGAPSSQMGMVQQSQAQASPFQQIAGLGVAGVSAAAAGAKAGLF